MSGIFAYFALGADAKDMAVAVRRALSVMTDRGRDPRTVDCGHGVLGLVTHDWQEVLCGGSYGSCQDVRVVADATLYYRDDLVRKLRAKGVEPASLGSADLIAAAVVAWGASAPEHLEGDFAFVAWLPQRNEVVAARDQVGMRTLYYSFDPRGALAIASTASAIVAAGLAPGDMNLGWLGELCCSMVAKGDETVYAKVNSLRPAQRLVWLNREQRPAVSHYWEPPHFSEEGHSDKPFAEAAEELRALLLEAVRQRLAPSGVTAVTLSGGRDSSSVYACGRRAAGDAVQPVSLSYPPGDIGRDDEVILDILARVGGRPTFVPTREIPLFGDFLAYARTRPDPFGHPYVNFHHALAERAVEMGARVAFNGIAGDALFRTGPSFLSDLLFSARPWRAVREGRALGYRVPGREFLRVALLPQLGPGFRRILRLVGAGHRFPDPLSRPLVPWLTPDFVREVLVPRQAEWDVYRFHGARRGQDREHHWLLASGFAERILPEYCRVFLERGVEQRSPLHDLRLVHFAASRPRRERATGRDHKLLLREAMRGWLPESVVSDRPRRTGHNRDYVSWALSREAPQVVRVLGDRPVMANLGIVVAPRLREVSAELRTGAAPGWFAGWSFTVLAEAWLRGRS